MSTEDLNQYFDEDPSVESKPVSFAKTICGTEFEFKTDRGVFSRGSLDKATEVLLKEFDENYSGNPMSIVDVGCGYGPIVTFVAKKFEDAKVLAVDTNERARTLCAHNYGHNIGDGRLKVISPSQIDSSLKHDLIISNPPIRIGKTALYELLSFWSITLSEHGEMWLVMAKHLGADSCAKFLKEDCNLKITRVASKKGFRILKCTR